MKVIQTTADRAILDVHVDEMMNIEAALLGYHRNQQLQQTPFGCRIEALHHTFRYVQDECWKQDARARGLTVEGDEPFEAGAF